MAHAPYDSPKPATQAVPFQNRSPGAVVCVTDACMEPVPGARCCYGGRAIQVADSGRHVVLEGTTTLAGSCVGLLDAFKTLTNILNLSIPAASDAVSAGPAARGPRFQAALFPHVGASVFNVLSPSPTFFFSPSSPFSFSSSSFFSFFFFSFFFSFFLSFPFLFLWGFEILFSKNRLLTDSLRLLWLLWLL